MKTVALFANCEIPRAAEVVGALAERASGLGLGLCAWGATATLLAEAGLAFRGPGEGEVDCVMALGGDGTMLRAVRETLTWRKPVMGVNIGSLGFLTSVAEDDLGRALECLAADRYTTTTRSLLECTVIRAGREAGPYRALNDLVVRNSATGRIVALEVSVSGDTSTTFMADGLIVATPTGSTAHSLSAGGPILLPASSAFVVCFICAHTLSTRPLVLSDRDTIEIRVGRCGGDVLLLADGQAEQPLEQGDAVRVRRSALDATFIHLPGYSYFAVLRQKLHWRGSNV